MTTPPASLIDRSIEDLLALSAFLAGEIPSNSRSIPSLPPEIRLSKETLLTISVLLAKLKAVREREHARTSSPMRPSGD